MSTDNKALWDRVCKTDPKAVKPITGKQYSGNSPKPYYIVERLTEEFGPCGKGWGFTVINERFERFSDTDSLHIALVEFWYIHEGNRCAFQQMGQTKASYMSNAQKFILDEDAPKKSVTDALVKCASYLGFAGDIFSGRWDDSKYVAELKKEFSEPERTAKGVPMVDADKRSPSVAQAVMNDAPPIPPARQAELVDLAAKIARAIQTKGAEWCHDRLGEEELDDIELIFLANQMTPATRGALKAVSIERNKIKAAEET